MLPPGTLKVFKTPPGGGRFFFFSKLKRLGWNKRRNKVELTILRPKEEEKVESEHESSRRCFQLGPAMKCDALQKQKQCGNSSSSFLLKLLNKVEERFKFDSRKFITEYAK